MTVNRFWLGFVLFGVVFNVFAAVWNVWVLDLRWAFLLVPLNIVGAWVCWRSFGKMRRLRREHIARIEQLERRMEHAIARGDVHDVFLTRQLMMIWGVRPSQEDQVGGGEPS